MSEAESASGTFEVLERRLHQQASALKSSAQALNRARSEEFGSAPQEVLARVNVRTENNCTPRDIVQVGELLLFGYNVFIGLRTETSVKDVFALFRLTKSDSGAEMQEVAIAGTFLSEAAFVSDFEELYRYYKHTQLLQLMVRDGKLLLAFQMGERITDMRVFRFSVSADGRTIRYIDNRGERDIALPPAFDFQWRTLGRDHVVQGRHPHISVEDELFVETIGGDLTIKVENNTATGLGIYSEPVEDETQSLDDAEFHYARLGSLILLKIKPYRETAYRYLIYNSLTNEVRRVDAMGDSCVQLPEDHGLVFPGGFYLQSGQFKTFDDLPAGLRFKRKIVSPNGEDVLYVFYEAVSGRVALLAYNLIEKSLKNPLLADGYALSEDGTLVIFAASAEASRVHPMQVWRTPFFSAEFASREPPRQSFYGRIGNAELVRGIAALMGVAQFVEREHQSARIYLELAKAARKVFDDYYWIAEGDASAAAEQLKAIAATAELAVDEFEKMAAIRAQSQAALDSARGRTQALLRAVDSGTFDRVDTFVARLAELAGLRGELAALADHRYMDRAALTELDAELERRQHQLAERTVGFLADAKALAPYHQKIADLNAAIAACTEAQALTPVLAELDATAQGLDLLSELMAGLAAGDATTRTQVVDAIASLYGLLNQSRAGARHRHQDLAGHEATAQFAAQIKLFNQSLTNALTQANTPSAADEQLARLLSSLEELESQFAEFDQFLADILSKREELLENFEAHKQQLVDAANRRANNLSEAAARMLASIEQRAAKAGTPAQLHTFFAADPLVAKVRQVVTELRGLDQQVRADDLESRLKAVRDSGTRALRDKSDLFEAGGQVVKLGPRHRFSVNTQPLELTLLPRGGALTAHLTGTQYYQVLEDPELEPLKAFFDVSAPSESAELYRGEYLAGEILLAARTGAEGLSEATLEHALLVDNGLADIAAQFAAPRFREGFEKGIHDRDAAAILAQLLPALSAAGLLLFDPASRALAQLYWAAEGANQRGLIERARVSAQLKTALNSDRGEALLAADIAIQLQAFAADHNLQSLADSASAALYLARELAGAATDFVSSAPGRALLATLQQRLSTDSWLRLEQALDEFGHAWGDRYRLAYAWLEAAAPAASDARFLPEAAAELACAQRLARRPLEAQLDLTVQGLFGEHPRIQNRQLRLAVDQFDARLTHHRHHFVAGYQRFQQARAAALARERKALAVESFKARPLTSFVRNRLINDVYLPLIGDNLAKQMGTVGENKRTDLMGLLLLISPPGYGKTTLIEYVANRLGLVFVKVNCPALGHSVTSLDPAKAPNATAAKELEKLNLAFEMGDNTLLYLDDIQHTDPEFLQKFISLCDGTRRIEGVFRGQTKTYDLRGRKFGIIMAGNPYTESGDVFKIPDMLANRADIYNLGDVLGGREDAFALSYIENGLTSNPVLAPLATRDIEDVYRFAKLAAGEAVPTSEFSFDYAQAEVEEIKTVLRHLFVIRDVVLKVNAEYIRSAATADQYREEPPFKLQGSYRNMNKMAEKVSAIMTAAELEQLIDDHYRGEAQLLTTGAEENLLKLKALLGRQSPAEAARWQTLKAEFNRQRSAGGAGADVGRQVVLQLADLVASMQSLAAQRPALDLMPIANAIRESNSQPPAPAADHQELLSALERTNKAMADYLAPIAKNLHRISDIDRRALHNLRVLAKKLEALEGEFSLKDIPSDDR